MGVAYEVIDFLFVIAEEGMDVVLVDDFGSLDLGKDEVGEEEETDPTVERDPVELSAFVVQMPRVNCYKELWRHTIPI
jgi:hypothetical protein